MPVRKGDLLFTSEPFSFVLDPIAAATHCSNCLQFQKENATLPVPCGGPCLTVRYCSDTCNDSAWPNHRYECQASVQRIGMSPFSLWVRLLVRVIVRLQEDGKDEEEWVDLDTIRTFADLESHHTELLKKADTKKEIDSAYSEVKQILGESIPIPSFEEFTQIYGKVFANKQVIHNDYMKPIGLGLYLGASLLDHSCHPTAYLSFRGPLMTVRAIVESPTQEWNKVRVSYTPALSTVGERQQYFRSNYMFTCNCHVCTCPLYNHMASAVKCRNPKCSGPIFLDGFEDARMCQLLETLTKEGVNCDVENNNKEIATLECCEYHKCNGNLPAYPISKDITPNFSSNISLKNEDAECSCCGEKNSRKELGEKFSSIVEETKKVLGGVITNELPSLEQCTSIAATQGDLLHPLNPWRGMTLDAVFRNAVAFDNSDIASTIGHENVAAYRFHYGSTSPFFGMFLYKLGESELQKSLKSKAYKLLEEARTLLKPCLGASHPLISNILSKLIDETEYATQKHSEDLITKQAILRAMLDF